MIPHDWQLDEEQDDGRWSKFSCTRCNTNFSISGHGFTPQEIESSARSFGEGVIASDCDAALCKRVLDV